MERMPGNTPEITNKPTEDFINDKVDIKFRQFTEEELDAVLKKKKKRKRKKTKTQKLQASKK